MYLQHEGKINAARVIKNSTRKSNEEHLGEIGNTAAVEKFVLGKKSEI